MSFFSKIGNLFSAGATSLVKDLAGIVDTFISNPQEKQAAIEAMTKIANEHTQKMHELAVKETESYLADMQSARNMQIEALKQDDQFAKRFIYYLATLVIILAFAFDFCMFFVHYPAENRDMINGAAGVLNTGALIMVLSFFFGSSKSSEDKTALMHKMIK